MFLVTSFTAVFLRNRKFPTNPWQFSVIMLQTFGQIHGSFSIRRKFPTDPWQFSDRSQLSDKKTGFSVNLVIFEKPKIG